MSGPKTFRASEVAAWVSGQLLGDDNPTLEGVAELQNARPTELSFLANKKYIDAFSVSSAGAILIPDSAQHLHSQAACLIVCENPYLSLATAMQRIFKVSLQNTGRHPSAYVAEDAYIAESAWVGPHCVVESGANIGPGTELSSQVYVGEDVRVGRDVKVHPQVRLLKDTIIGDRCILHPGATLGSDGFGFAVDGDGRRHKIPQVGRVRLESDCEIGANTCIDRATFGETLVRAGTKIDNLVQIAHNVELGENVVVVSQSGVAGSSKLGDRVVVGAQVGIAGHAEITNDVMFAARSGVPSDIKKSGVYAGLPVVPHKRWLREVAANAKTPEILKRLRALESLKPTQYNFQSDEKNNS